MSDIANRDRIHRHNDYINDIVALQFEVKPFEHLLLRVHFGFLDILIHEGEHCFTFDLKNIHRNLKFLPHRDFLSKLSIKALLHMFDVNKAAMYIDFELCGLSKDDPETGFYHMFSKRLVHPSERSISNEDLAFVVWNVLAIRRFFLLTIINCVKITSQQPPILMTDPLSDFEEVKSCGVAVFQLFAENKVLCEKAVHPRFDFNTFSAENFPRSFQAFTPEYLESYSDEDLVEVYGRLIYTFHNRLTVRTHLSAKEVFMWLLNARGFSSANLTPAQILDRATQSTLSLIHI